LKTEAGNLLQVSTGAHDWLDQVVLDECLIKIYIAMYKNIERAAVDMTSIKLRLIQLWPEK